MADSTGRNPSRPSRPATASSDVAVAVVGAGPHALTVCAHLLHRYPVLAGDIAVFDPAGAWLTGWNHRFAALDIGWLRSPAVHHPHPEPYALLDFRAARPELISHGHLPGRELFAAFCAEVAAEFRLERTVQPLTVESVVPSGSGVRLETGGGGCPRARLAIVATNPGRPRIPGWARGCDGIRHAEGVDVRDRRFSGAVVIVGGGLTAAHMALGVAARGGHAVIIARNPCRVRPFDTDPGWLGPKEMDGFLREPSLEVRARLIRDARGGGSIPPAYADALAGQIAAGAVTWQTGDVVAARPATPQGWEVAVSGCAPLAAVEVWLATGWRHDVRQVRLLDPLRRAHPIPDADGLPGLASDLSWPGTEVFLMGALAGLQLGPTALNLSGARQASARITSAIGRRLGLDHTRRRTRRKARHRSPEGVS